MNTWYPSTHDQCNRFTSAGRGIHAWHLCYKNTPQLGVKLDYKCQKINMWYPSTWCSQFTRAKREILRKRISHYSSTRCSTDKCMWAYRRDCRTYVMNATGVGR